MPIKMIVSDDTFDDQKKMINFFKWVSKSPIKVSIQFDSCKFIGLDFKSNRSKAEDAFIYFAKEIIDKKDGITID